MRSGGTDRFGEFLGGLVLVLEGVSVWSVDGDWLLVAAKRLCRPAPQCLGLASHCKWVVE